MATSFNRIPGADPKVSQKLDKAANNGVESVSARIDTFRKAISKVGKNLQTSILSYLADPLRAGKAAELLQLQTEITAQLNQLGYADLVRDFTNSFDQSQQSAAEAAAAIGVTALTPLDSNVLANLKGTSYAWLNQLGQQAVAEVAQGVAMNALVGGNKANMIERISKALTKFQNHASTYAETALATYDREVQMQTFVAAGVTKFVYFGPKDIKNRDFCRGLIGKAYSLDEIDKLDNGSTLKPVSRFGGGWNCRHVWMPAPEKVDTAAEEAKAAVDSALAVDASGAVNAAGKSMTTPFPLQQQDAPTASKVSKIEWVPVSSVTAGSPAVTKQAVLDQIGKTAEKPAKGIRMSDRVLLQDNVALAQATAAKLQGRTHVRLEVFEQAEIKPKVVKPKPVTLASLLKEINKLQQGKDLPATTLELIDRKTAQLATIAQPTIDKAKQAVVKAQMDVTKAKSAVRVEQAKARLEKAQAKLHALKSQLGELLPDLFPGSDGAALNSALSPAKVDRRWAATKRGGFTFEARADVGGGHGGKKFFRDNTGEQWLFKPIKNQADTFLAAAEESAYRVARLVDASAVQVRAIALEGELGTIQPVMANVGSLGGIPMEALTAEQVQYLQKQHVIDWLTSNHDAHRKQFLQTAEGKLIEIDRGQAWKYFGKDTLDARYHPNSIYGEEPPIYNLLFDAAKKGRVKIDPQGAYESIKSVEAISDPELLDAVSDYVDRLPFRTKAAKQQWIDALLARKNGIRGEFEEFYRKALDLPDFRFEEPKPRWKYLDSRNAAAADEVAGAGWQGRTLFIDAEQIEDHDVLVFEQTFKGQKQTVLQFKLRPDAAAAFFDESVLPKSNVSNSIFSKLVKGEITESQIPVKDGWGNPITPEKKAALLREVEEYNASRKKSLPNGFTKEATDVRATERRIRGGNLEVVNPDVSFATVGGNESKIGSGVRINGNGISLRMSSPTDGRNFSHGGLVEVTVDGAPSSSLVDETLGKLADLGINTNTATALDEEWIYLQKHAYLHKIDGYNEWKAIASLPKEDRVIAGRKFWSKRLAVEDIAALPEYQPAGRELGAWNASEKKGGFRVRERFDLRTNDINGLKDLVLAHADTSGDFIGTLDSMLENTRYGLATEQRLRLGIRSKTMSQNADIETGGASYFFTSIRSEASMGTYLGGRPWKFVFKRDVLRRLDAISYRHDSFGKVRPEYIAQNRLSSTLSEIRAAAQGHVNETIVKGGLDLLGDLDYIITQSPKEKGQVLALFQKHGIERLRDGRPIAEVIR